MRLGMVTVLLMAALVGCTGGGRSNSAENGSENKSRLVAVLSRARSTDSARKYVRYGNLGEVQKLAGVDGSRFASLRLVAAGMLGPWSELISESLGFDPLSFREALDVGVPGAWAGIRWGDYDLRAVNDRFAAFGIERTAGDGVTTWAIDADNQSEAPGPLDLIAGPKTFNIARTQPGAFAYGIRRDTLAWITDPGEDTLAKDPTIKALATCLDDVVAAVIERDLGWTQTLAVGIRAASASDVTAVICVAPGARDQAEEIRRTTAGKLANGSSRGGQPWSALLPGATSELTGDAHAVVRVLAKLGADLPPGAVLRELTADELPELLGVR